MSILDDRVGLSVGGSVGRWAGGSFVRHVSVGGSSGRSLGWWVGGSVGRLAGRLVGRWVCGRSVSGSVLSSISYDQHSFTIACIGAGLRGDCHGNLSKTINQQQTKLEGVVAILIGMW
jgi:hypothetical protein